MWYIITFMLGFFFAAELFNLKFRDSTKIFLMNVYHSVQEASRKRKAAKQQEKDTKKIDVVR
jgi:hypothetical protein